MARYHPRAVTDYSTTEAARRAGVDKAFVDWLIELGVIEARPNHRLTAADVRRVQLTRTLENAGVPLEGLAAMMRRGELSMAFLDTPTYERFSALSEVTFAALAERTGIPLDLLLMVREATGSAVPQPTDFLREDELQIVPFLNSSWRWGSGSMPSSGCYASPATASGGSRSRRRTGGMGR
jgi:DNA-binding transcriptional MerR regulator